MFKNTKVVKAVLSAVTIVSVAAPIVASANTYNGGDTAWNRYGVRLNLGNNDNYYRPPVLVGQGNSKVSVTNYGVSVKAGVIDNKGSYSLNDKGGKVYNFTMDGKQLMESTTDFSKLDYKGSTGNPWNQDDDGGRTEFRYWANK